MSILAGSRLVFLRVRSPTVLASTNDVIWAIEEGAAHRLEHLSVVTLVSLADSLDLYPGQLFVDADVPPPVPPMPDDVMLEAALFELGTSVTCEDLAAAFGWTLARIDRALAALRQLEIRDASESAAEV